MVDRAFFVRKGLTDKYVWGVMVLLAVGVLGHVWIEGTLTTGALSIVGMCGTYLFFLINKGRRPVVLLREEHLEVDQGGLVLLRYRDIVSVSISGQKIRLALSVDGGTKETVIDVSELAPADVDELVGLLQEQSASR